MKAINHLILYMYQKKFINLTEKRFLLATSDFNSRSFYLLPKIHKIHFSIPNIQPKCRPIVNCKFCESYNIAIFIDFFLQTIVSFIPSYTKDTFHFIAKLRQINVNKNSILVTADVESLCTNIPLK